jgi:hypothetical protein
LKIEDKILKLENVNWRNLKPFQNENLKEMSIEQYGKLKQSFVRNNNIDILRVWQQGNTLWLLDGHGRQKAFYKFIDEGIDVPDELPAIFLDFKSKKEAAEAILIWGSSYQTFIDEGLNEFIHNNDLLHDLPEVMKGINLNNFNIDGFIDSNFDVNTDELIPIEKDFECNIEKGKYLVFGKYKIPLTYKESEYIEKQINEYADKNGILNGFVGELFSL